MYPEDLAEKFKDRAGQKYRPSNGFEGDLFMGSWCAHCSRDAAHRADPDGADGCPIIAATHALDVDDEGYPAEWQYGPDGQPRCTAFTETGAEARCDQTLELFS